MVVNKVLVDDGNTFANVCFTFLSSSTLILISESEIFEKSEIRKSKSFQNVKIGNQIMVKLLQTFVLRFYHHQRCFHIIIMISSVWIIIKFWKTSIMIILNIIMSNVDDPDLGFSLLLFDH